MTDFKKLCEIIIDKSGIIACEDMLECGYKEEHFERIKQSHVKAEKLLRRARENLHEMGIFYKEEI